MTWLWNLHITFEQGNQRQRKWFRTNNATSFSFNLLYQLQASLKRKTCSKMILNFPTSDECRLFRLRCQLLWIFIFLSRKEKRIDVNRTEHCVKHPVPLRWNVSDGNWMLPIVSEWLTNYVAIAYDVIRRKKKRRKSVEYISHSVDESDMIEKWLWMFVMASNGCCYFRCRKWCYACNAICVK